MSVQSEVPTLVAIALLMEYADVRLHITTTGAAGGIAKCVFTGEFTRDEALAAEAVLAKLPTNLHKLIAQGIYLTDGEDNYGFLEYLEEGDMVVNLSEKTTYVLGEIYNHSV